MCRNRLSLIVKSIRFHIVGQNPDGQKFELMPSSFLELTRCHDTVIIVARVVSGKIKNGDVLAIKFSMESLIFDIVENLQYKKRDISEAEKGMSIGIKLRKLTFEALKDLNDYAKK